MPLHSLALSVNPNAWRMFSARRTAQAFKPVSEKIWQRDDYTCQFCGFQARQFQEVVNLDGNYRNNKANNLITACIFCTQCLFLESVGVEEFGGGTIIYLPEMQQPELNSFCHVIFCAMANDTNYQETSQALYRSFKFRSQIVEEQFGEGTSTPSVLGQLMIEAGMTRPKWQKKVLQELRLLPSRVKFKKEIEAWAAAAMNEMSSE